MPALVQLEHRLAAFEVVADEHARLLELREHAVDGGEPDVHAFLEQHLVDVLGGEVAHVAVLEQVEDPQARQRRLQADGLEVVGCSSWRG